jgi:hypothetical protein
LYNGSVGTGGTGSDGVIFQRHWFELDRSYTSGELHH